MPYTFKHGDRPLDDFTIQRAVGSGGFGEVYYAVSDGGREVALKYLKVNPQIELRGVSHCINLKSPYLVSIFDVKKNSDGEYFIVMEYCSGPSLRDLLSAEPAGFEPQKAAFLVREIAKGLAYLHDRGIVHRDLKPGNIFYDDAYVKIGDYGLSKFISVSRHSAQTASVGTVHYMAPEIGSGDYSRGVDIYALGVMLYEMLLGKVPFEGSSMGEILMKHLTTQPELDELPKPFGKIIRKALEKDPKDRYQSVHQMVEELLEAENVKESLAGFSMQSLDGAVHRGATGDHVSPVPSPNPPPGHARDFERPAAANRGPVLGPPPVFPERLAKRMDRISRKIDKATARLGGKVKPHVPPPGPHDAMGSADAAAVFPRQPGERRRRMALSSLLSLGLIVGLGVLVGNTVEASAGAVASMLVVAMAGGILLARRAVNWFGVEPGVTWPPRLIRAGCCAPLLAIGAAPSLVESNPEGLAIWLGLLVLSVFGRWEKDLAHGSSGDLRFGIALWTAFVGFILTVGAMGITEANTDEFGLVGGGVAGVVSLILQTTAWWLGTGGGAAQAYRRRRPAEDEEARDPGGDGIFVAGIAIGGDVGLEPPFAQPVGQAADSALSPDEPEAFLQRWAFTRACWGVVAFIMMSTVIVASLWLGLVDHAHDEHTYGVLTIIAAGCLLLFAIRKTSPVPRVGFWRESLRPGIASFLMFMIGGLITGIARHWGCMTADGQVGLIAGLVVSSLFLILLGVTSLIGGRRRPPQPFLQVGSAAGDSASSEPDAGCAGSDGPGDSPPS